MNLGEPGFRKRLERLRVRLQKLPSGKKRADRRSRNRGESIEFSGHRPYSPGDDLRYLDWNVYARQRELFVKEFTARASARVRILMDLSPSMDYGSPSRFHFVKQLTAALSFLVLSGTDSLSVYGLGEEFIPIGTDLQGTGSFHKLIDQLEAIRPRGTDPLSQALKLRKIKGSTGDVCFVLSDFYDRESLPFLLRGLGRASPELYGLQVMTPRELDPELEGPRRLRDMESGATKWVRTGEKAMNRYVRSLQSFLHHIRSLFFRYGSGYLPLTTDTSLEEAVLSLVKRGMLRTR